MAMTSREFKEEWLFSNALVAFVGALMLTQQWQVSGGAIRFYFFEVPEIAGFAIFLIIAGFFVLSFFLAVASVIPLIRNVALLIGKKVSFALDFVVWIGFVLSWAAAITDLPVDQWWAEMLLWGGLALIVFMLVKMVLRVVRAQCPVRTGHISTLGPFASHVSKSGFEHLEAYLGCMFIRRETRCQLLVRVDIIPEFSQTVSEFMHVQFQQSNFMSNIY